MDKRMLSEELMLGLCAVDKSNEQILSDKALPSNELAAEILEMIEYILFPKYFPSKSALSNNERPRDTIWRLKEKITGLSLSQDPEGRAEKIILSLIGIKEMLIKDAASIYEGDPAASSVSEVLLCYPGFLAIMIYRIAHLFLENDIPYLPRMLTEQAHRVTGIDIHPAASIGERFCIDHGTGIVIGETARIGDRVKIYQGVTIGARSFESDTTGKIIKGKKRHPDIGNDCIIYANATILGGDTVIGDRSIIGGNVWLTHSLAEDSRVYYKEK